MLYGKQLIHRDNDVTDKIGIRTLVLSQAWQPSSSLLSQEQIDAEQPLPPAVSGGLLLIGSQTRPSGGIYRTSWTFEGIRGDGKTVTFKQRNNTLDYSFEPGMSQVSIKHWVSPGGTDFKTFATLLAGYEGMVDDDGAVIWPATLSKAATARGLPGGSQYAGEGEPNPMFGVSEFFRMEGTYRVRYAALDVPGSLNSGVGGTATDLPGRPPRVGDRNWLKIAPQWRRRGNIVEIVETYWLSGPGGWCVPVYGQKGNTSMNPASSSSGLTTGTL